MNLEFMKNSIILLLILSFLAISFYLFQNKKQDTEQMKLMEYTETEQISGKIIDPPNKPPVGDKIKINGKEYTQEEYQVLKADRVDKVKKMKHTPITWEEARDWIDISNIELLGCPFEVKKGEDIIQAINEKVKIGC